MPGFARRYRLGLAVALLAGCSTEPVIRPSYVFTANATATDSVTGQSSNCQIQGGFGLDSFARVPWVVQNSQVFFGRTVTIPGQTLIKRDTVFLHLTIAGDYPDSQTVRLILGPPISDTLLAPVGNTSPAHGHGAWVCGPELPFAADTGLEGAGYRSTPPPTGQWALLPNLPIE